MLKVIFKSGRVGYFPFSREEWANLIKELKNIAILNIFHVNDDIILMKEVEQFSYIERRI